MYFCPFCSTAIIEYHFFENQYFYAIYNRSPILPGHSLVIPKKHLEQFNELDFHRSSALFPFVQQVIKILQSAFNVYDFDISLQDGKNAGQTVPHLHLHIIPRYVNDLPNPGDWYPILEKFENQELLDSYNRPIIPSDTLNEITVKLRNTAFRLFHNH